MSNQEEQRLHDLVREAMGQIQPSYEEIHWEQMQGKLHKIPQYPNWLWIGSVTCVVILISWFIWQNNNVDTSLTKTSSVATTSRSHTEQSKALPSVAPKLADTARKVISLQPKQNAPDKAENPDFKTESTMGYPVESLITKTILPNPIAYPEISFNQPIEEDIRKRIEQRILTSDSIITKVWERNKSNWRTVALVGDFTSSMYPYATELFTWLDKNRKNKSIQGAVFFTDCDSLGQETIPNQTYGKMFTIHNWEKANVLSTFIDASRNTQRNIRLAENDLEAILYAQNTFPAIQSFVLIADNSSPIKDMHLLSQIKKPVHIIVCGSTYEENTGIQPDLIQLAVITKGSLHTVETDLSNLATIKSGTRVEVGGKSYKYKKGRFVLRKFHEFWK
ncbi:hypothetical protein QNI19_00025 [Cytophagaceae bacterium DM2B3-1]|uniref:VWA domain-containing protein n=1 Tax=Xanthocytophaga flava TaxID=3048013 RepID=A0ABT7CCD9_9BACT|nr:hypothetical protein [Xanthocytophaga flavus]MDJ1470147.1 hypothetical protein [Xanthocytophaga flavus]MDJ1491290.1 hypothetical protein [Xanthocytophaga flavus]